jgi:hypothetical protein
MLSETTRLLCGLTLITVPTIAMGGAFLLQVLTGKAKVGVSPLQQTMFRAGHAHAGVLLILALLGNILADGMTLPLFLNWTGRLSLGLAPVLVPSGFFLSVLKTPDKVGGLIQLTYLGMIALFIGVLIIGTGLLLSL